MSRIGKMCPGDCSKCELLEAEQVEMIPCILDQIFQRVRKNERKLEDIYSRISQTNGVPRLVNTMPKEEDE